MAGRKRGLLKLALIYHQFARRGGLENYLLEFVRRLQIQGHTLELVGSRFDTEIAELPVTVHRIRSKLPSSTYKLWHFDRAVRDLVMELQVDATLGFGRTTDQTIHRAGGGCHRIYSRLLPPFKQWKWKNRVELSLERQLYTGNGTRHFVVNSAMVLNQVREEYGVSPDRMSVIHTAVDTAKFHPADDPAERVEMRNPKGGHPVFLFVSLDHRRKGLDVLLDVWPEVDADLWIAGAPLGAAYRRIIKERRLEERVRWVGMLTDPASFFRAADFYIHPTRYDACSNTALQAIATGLPSILSRWDGASEFISSGVNGYVLKDPCDRGELHSLIRNMVNLSSAQRLAMGQEARARMLPLTWESHVERWETLIRRVTSED